MHATIRTRLHQLRSRSLLRSRPPLALSALILAAWLLLIGWQASPYAALMGHEALGEHDLPLALHVAVFLPGWLLMTVAMMLPANLPALLHADPTGRRALALRIGGYLLPWLLFGLLAYLGDSALHELTEHGGALEHSARWIAPAVVLAAGLYQLSPWKQRCTEQCQPGRLAGHPALEIRSGSAGAFQAGLRLGLACLGSGWALMLLLFALGQHQIGWMLGFAALMAAERYSPWPARLARGVGLILLLAAAGMVLTAIG